MPIIKQNLAAQDYNMYLFIQKKMERRTEEGKERGRDGERYGGKGRWKIIKEEYVNLKPCQIPQDEYSKHELLT